MNKIAFYLPQFHSIPENDDWWGKGFTEWTNVKASKPSFHGHVQPEIPLNNNYYNLLDINTQIWQAELAKKYGVNGFCYYHYWFEGKQLLEKPMENMLHCKQIDLPFCICWANETWARTWDGKENDILIKQNYDEDKDAWTRHFDYLLSFFRDKRYIKDQGRPLIILYKPHLIKNCKSMVDYWRELAMENGFPNLYIGMQHPSALQHDYDKLGVDFSIEFEPLYTSYIIDNETIIGKMRYAFRNPIYVINKIKKKLLRYPDVLDYDMIWRTILNRKPRRKHIAAGAFPAWDNTPRKGRNARLYYKSTPDKFLYYLNKRVEHALKYYDMDYLFINAWNEWGEGAHLEPDEVNGYGYLEAIRNLKV